MNQILGTIAGVVVGAILAIIASMLQQRRQWARDDLTWNREVDKDVRTLRYEAFREYLTACNQINALRIAH